jgi:hypothetical protein
LGQSDLPGGAEVLYDLVDHSEYNNMSVVELGKTDWARLDELLIQYPNLTVEIPIGGTF